MKTGIIQSLDRGLKILQVIGKAQGPLSLSDIAGNFSMDRSSVFRLIDTLILNGFVLKDTQTKRYSLGYKVMELSGAFGEQSRIEGVIRPIMKKVCAATLQDTHMGILDRDEVVFIAVEQPRSSMTVHIPVGTREPAGFTALGRSLISSLGDQALDDLVSSMDLKRYTVNTLCSARILIREIEKVKKEGVSVDNEEYKPGIICFAAPIWDNRGEVRYSIGISGSRDTVMPRYDEFRDLVRDAGIEASERLGGSRFRG
ncbi:MAG: IclR family transcriptional regulator [Thermodesulfobacteriota bacterium]|nr:IclR family transcriptional regulator [Thermodesulfobacteriota bacterium]